MFALSGYTISTTLYHNTKTILYKAIRELDKKAVIIKLLNSEYPAPKELFRLRYEYEITQKIQANGIIKSYSLEPYDNGLALILEDCDGVSLKNYLKQHTLHLETTLKIITQIAETLEELHQQSVIHKDIKPANIIFNPDTEQVKLTDFSISTLNTIDNQLLTAPNVLEGTLAYMSPEQTGRMNRKVDHRSDFYSLGITFYEILVGQLPFNFEDSLELVHAHIAKQPLAPHQLNPSIPEPISNIVLKLLEKNAESRYQSAFGLKMDLQICLHQLQTTGKIEPFNYGQYDLSEQFQISQKLYGRKTHIETLLASFDKACQGQMEMVLISGYAGIGKTALVQEIYKPITERKGYFISGQFEQFKRNTPYSAIIQAFEELIKQLLVENETKLKEWQEKLQTTLGNNAQVIIDVIPELELIIGSQLPLPNLPPNQALNRFNLVFQNFISTFTKPEHPLVIFLDDLQWADSASLKLLQSLITAPYKHHLLIIAAYRDHEVKAAHPLQLTLEEIYKTNQTIKYISLPPLNLTDINYLLADTLNTSLVKTQALSELIINKTQGNPFFVIEFLKSLYKQNFLYFQKPTSPLSLNTQQGWQWDLSKIQICDITDNLVELTINKIQKLSPQNQNILQLAACIGQQFELETLISVSGNNAINTINSLQEAVLEGLILPLNNDPFQLSLLSCSTLLTIEKPPLASEYKFVHERIRQAAYSLIPTKQQQQIHYQIGQVLTQNSYPYQQSTGEHIFGIVNQLNLGRYLILEQTKKDELAKLNLLAAQKAKISAAYESALKYLKISLELIGEQAWQRLYQFTLSVSVEASEMAYLIGTFNQMEILTDNILQNAHSLLDKISAYEIKMQAYKAQNNPSKAIETGLLILKHLNIHFPSNPNKLHFLIGSLTTKLALLRRPISALSQLPTMTDPKQLAIMRILLSISPAIYAIRPELLPLITFKRVKLSIKYGNAYESAPAYASYGYLLCAMENDIETGFQFGQLALQLLLQHRLEELKARIYQIVHGVITHYKEHVKTTLLPLKEAYQSGLETGNLEYAALSATTYIMHAYFVGKELSTLTTEITTFTETFKQLKQENSLYINCLYQQVLLNLQDVDIKCPTQLIGKAYDENQMLPLHLQQQAKGLVFQVYINKLILCYLFEDYQNAYQNALTAEKYLEAVIGSLLVPLFHFYDSLARLAWYPKANLKQQQVILKKVAANQEKMKYWAHHAPMNYSQKFYLVEAERAKILNNFLQARELYDQAIDLAHQHHYHIEEALSHELASKFYQSRRQIKIAQVYLKEAYHIYERWGANRKLKSLENNYSQLILANNPFSLQPAILTSKNPSLFIPQSFSNTVTIQSRLTDLDLTTVFKASQAFVGEIVLKKLLKKLMRIAIENAGAQHGLLILEQADQWIIHAKASIERPEIDVSQIVSLEDSVEVSAGIVHYVIRTKGVVVLSDASKSSKFMLDPHIYKNQPRSILALPLINQDKIIAVLYLENNLVAGAFTPERLEILHLLSSQMAISIENARLYADLEDKVRERTRDLAAQNAKLIVLNEELIKLNQDKNEFLGIAAHDLKNPLSAIQGLSEMIERDFDDLTRGDIIEIANMISVSSQQMFELIRNLLDVNRIESGKLNVSLDRFNILPILKWIANDYRDRAKAKHIKLHFQPSEEEYYAIVDEKTIRQVFDNLISNAIKYSPHERTVYLRLYPYRNHLHFEVEDQGPGLSEEDKKHLFGKFSRLTPQPTGDENSTGLGLFIVKKLVESMKGKIWCESELGYGSKFTVEFITEMHKAEDNLESG